MMKPTYLSYELEASTPAYGGDRDLFRVVRVSSIEAGSTSNNSRLDFPAHIGTHIDFPYHFDNLGMQSHGYEAAFWVFSKAGVLCCSVSDMESSIESLDPGIEILILKTGFGKKRASKEYCFQQPVIPAYYASLLRKRFPALRVFGFDMISLTSKLDRAEGKKAHLAFLVENGILVLEDMNLEHLDETPQTIVVAPLLAKGLDGVPCTVIAF
jgi:kynurenine formamidase